MLVFELINKDLKPLGSDESASRAVSVMRDQSVSYYPVIDESTGQLLGEASLDELQESDSERTQGLVDTSLPPGIFLRDTDHILDASRTMLKHNRTFLPVVDRSGNYTGTVTKAILMDSVIRLLNLRDSGTVIMIEMEPRDYMLSDVIRIIEAEGARILSLTIQAPDSMQDRFRVSVKLNLDDLARVGSALRRYGYLITAESYSIESDQELYQKAEEFFRYLDI